MRSKQISIHSIERILLLERTENLATIELNKKKKNCLILTPMYFFMYISSDFSKYNHLSGLWHWGFFFQRIFGLETFVKLIGMSSDSSRHQKYLSPRVGYQT